MSQPLLRRIAVGLTAIAVTVGALATPAVAATRPIRVPIIGDSTANGLASAIAAWSATHHGPLVVDRQPINGCSLIDANAQNMVVPAEWASVPRGCRDWAGRMMAQRSFRPDVVFAVFGPTQAADARPGNSLTVTNVLHDNFQWFSIDQAARLRAEFPSAVFVWASAPRTFFGSMVIPENRWLINDARRVAAWNALVLGMSRWRLSARLHMAQFIETAPGGWRDRNWRPDGVHVTGAALTKLAAWAANALIADYRYFHH